METFVFNLRDLSFPSTFTPLILCAVKTACILMSTLRTSAWVFQDGLHSWWFLWNRVSVHSSQWYSCSTGSGGCGDPVSSRSIWLFNHRRLCVVWKLWNVGSSGNTKVQRVKSNMKHFGGNPSKVAFLTQAQADLVWFFICYLLCQRTFSIKPL